jgi:hypothetical protein
MEGRKNNSGNLKGHGKKLRQRKEKWVALHWAEFSS